MDRIPHTLVIDEVAGQAEHAGGIPVTPRGALAGFLIFRVLDVVKPWPAGSSKHCTAEWA